MITFSPALCETTILNIPFHPGHLTFTATVEDGQFDTRSIIQIWTDIADNSQSSGEQAWSSRSFQFEQNASVASLSIPFLDFVHPFRSQFSFTYRILHPDGYIQWLGEFRRNGSLIVNRYDDRLVLFGDWSTNTLGHVFTPKSAIKSPLQVFSLSEKIQWRCWNLSNRFVYNQKNFHHPHPVSSAPRLLSADDGPSHVSSALLVPSQPKAAIVPLSPILLTSQDVQITIHPAARSVYITSPSKGGQLSLQTLSPDALVTSLTASFPSAVSIPDPDNRHARLLVYPDRAPTRLFLLPLSPDSSASAPSALFLPLSPILSHVQFLSNASSSYFSVSNPTRFASTSADHIQLNILDFGGAQFSLSPVYDLVKPDGDVRLSLLSKHNRIASPISHSLLTPPPSPPLSAAENESQSLQLPEDSHQLPDQLPVLHVHHVDDQTSQPLEPVLTSGQSTPSPDVQEQLASGQTTPKPRPAVNDSSDPTPSVARPVERVSIMRLIHFVLRILVFYTRMLSRIVLSIFGRLFPFNVPNREPVATPKIKTVELDDDQTENEPASVSSAVHTPALLTPRAGTPKRQHSGASTPALHNDAINSLGHHVPGVAETLEAVTTKIVPELTADIGEEEKPQEDLGDSYPHEPKPNPDSRNEKSGHNEKWEVIHRPGIVFELAALPSPPITTEGEPSPKIKPIRLTVDGAESAVKTIKFHLDDVEVTDVKIESLTGPEQGGLWTVEVPRMTRDLMVLRVS